MAERIGRAEGTLKVHLKNILQMRGVDDRTEAVTTAMRRASFDSTTNRAPTPLHRNSVPL
jgi:DNA-binding NarL/FixJ family response regulator